MRGTPEETVLAFAKAYTDWEIQMAQSETSFRDQKLKDEHARILATFCTIKKRAYIDGGVTFSEPPTYGELAPDKIVNALKWSASPERTLTPKSSTNFSSTDSSHSRNQTNGASIA